jgi:hypothetical protein
VAQVKAKILLLYERGRDVIHGEKELTIVIKDGLKGTRLFNAITKHLEAADHGDWIRWNLLDIIVKGEPGYE